MTHVADRFVVILDANVLFPFRKRDALLRFYEAGLFRVRWTQRVMDEWTRRLIERKPALEESVRIQEMLMRDHFKEAWITDYEPLIDGLVLPDPDDRHVLAAAIKCGAQHIVTDNLKDFPIEALRPYDVEAIDADEFLSRTFELYQAESLAVLKAMRGDYRNPSYTPSEFILDLIAKGLPKLAARARQSPEAL